MFFSSLLFLFCLFSGQQLTQSSFEDFDDSNERHFDYYEVSYNPNLHDVLFEGENHSPSHQINRNSYGNDYDDNFNWNFHNNNYDDLNHDYSNIGHNFDFDSYGNDYDDNFFFKYNNDYDDGFGINGYENHQHKKSYNNDYNYNYPYNYDPLAFLFGDNGNDYNFPTYGLGKDGNSYPDDSKENALLGLTQKSEDELWKAIYDFETDIQARGKPKTTDENFPILQRRKRASRSSSSRSSSSRSSSRRSSSSSSSSSSSGGFFGSKKSDSDSFKPKPKTEDKAPVDKSSYPKAHYPQVNSNPSGSNPAGGYPTGSGHTGGYPQQPSSGYPHQPSSGYPQQPSAGYPHQPSAGYPHQTSAGYPHQPSAGYPHQPSPGYPHQPSSGYPHQPSSGYPQQPSVGYPNQPSPGYPHQPSGGYPSSGYPHQPSSGYPHQSSSGYPHQSSSGFPHLTSSGFPGKTQYGPTSTQFGGSYPKSKKEKVMQKVQQALGVYAMNKMYKKNKKAKFVFPSAMGHGFHPGGGGGMHGFHGGGMHGMGGAMGAMGAIGGMKAGKKILGTIIKLQIAKYALKFGASAAKAYFEYKLGVNLQEHMIQKFIQRYHSQRTRNYYQQRRLYHRGNEEFKLENITLGEECVRECANAKPLICFFSLHIHLYQYLSRACHDCPKNKGDCDDQDCVVGSGRHKLAIVVNKQLPGPTIQVCEGDKVLLEVYNELPSAGLTLHFRGQTYSETPYAEGTLGVTQNLISPGELFSYSFKADVPGTHFWHANTGVMRSDGVFGPFVVKEKIDPLQHLYDIDLSNQTIMFNEDFVKSGEEQLVDLNYKNEKPKIFSLLINGRGFKQEEGNGQNYQEKVFSRINVQSDKRNRVRLISAVSSNCPVSFRVLGQEFSIIGREFSIISIDGFPVTPKNVHAVLISPSERIDIILNDIPIGLHWIEVKGYLDCENQTQYAILESKKLLDWHGNEEHFPSGWNFIVDGSNSQKVIQLPAESPSSAASKLSKFGAKTVHCNNTDVFCARNFTSNSALTTEMKSSNLTLYLSLTARPIHNEYFYSLIHYSIASMPVEERGLTSQINNLTLKLAHEPLLFNQRPLKTGVCSSAGVLRQHCVENFCECLHLQEIPLNKVIDVVFINEGIENSVEPQTMYFHGHNFFMISQSNTFIYSNESLDNSTSPYLDRFRVIVKDVEELLHKNTVNPIKMNSITVPAGGYAVIRFKATNPGFWLVESSSVFKSVTGMGMVFQVGEKKDYRVIPKKYNKC